ncbi:MAG TPA: UDP-3-O-(3-hydroxymyristoyl)glucosamine N-acyltransferase [Anaerohalosphaeraceae bacterium]|nr:UDP-3-O-(3-hydroxymyristoyl)glucosamine N-acyltransferase [Anaerohalosphaeraceae bacterium]HOM75279.1 UDP-3-O-(3-hydroxymyristoyl)glucosamine N-acyltransferase [Anaerohalosphaeraceae bacterium]HPC63121.1 UDP-3-O-(3-hydroxymyristoyl)glucosamine N-acyltransferase [Anaerohalosphaeraceae bacterium]HPO68910.1 UDP-3-O-(3-hydroxymyristoyl)glucosamine N-acyltransferase [Anaerohalosphaeraceae bacterium]HRS71676.1 UDP-3-O-(3-hydroxymyristoyl)glucosamine N-acyltransferase [Anaerohalosphaeraceae bacteri
MSPKTIQEIAEHVGGRVIGQGDVLISSAATLDNAGPGQITFLSNPKYTSRVKTTQAAGILVSKQVETDASQILVEDPYYAFMQAVVLLHGHRRHPQTGISEQASIASSAHIGSNCNIHAFAVICENAVIGNNCQIYSGVFIGPNAVIGNDCVLYPNAVIYDGCRLGNRVIVQSNASIGQDGFGFATHKGQHHKIPQIGIVILEDDVEIGSGCVVERGTLDDTVIGKGSKLGDLVAIGHGTKIGPHCLLVPQAGVAGSAELGHHCVLGGQVGVVGHIKVGNMVKIGAKAGVINDVPDGATLVGTPAIDANTAKRAYALIETLPQMRQKLRQLEKQIEGLTGGPKS